MVNIKVERPDLIFPKPKECSMKEAFTVLGETGKSLCCIIVDFKASEMEIESAEVLAMAIEKKIGVKPDIHKDFEYHPYNYILINIGVLKHGEGKNLLPEWNEEGYYLDVSSNVINILGISGKGTFYAVQTLVQLLSVSDNYLAVPIVEIKDWPDLKYRGLFVEDRYGSDLMKLKDWEDLIDYMASLKMNFLRIGVYGCWNIQYDKRISEYWYLPINKYPELKTQRATMYYSLLKRDWEIVDCLPQMYRGDFFKAIITYGKKKNVIVSPLFNSLAHNTLIPRIYPETSAKDELGNPTGYGFCTTNEKTYEVLFNIYNEIIEKYLIPNGIDWFHIGMDEVCPSLGIDIDNPSKEIDPWCKCVKCSEYPKEELIIRHIIRQAKYLKSKSINNISIYHDQLLKMNLINSDLLSRLKQEDIDRNMVFDWWKYSDKVFDTIKPEVGLRSFVMPIAGYYHWVLSKSHLTNIYNMLELAYKDMAEGAEAYCTFDCGSDRNYCCLSEYSWNSAVSSDLNEFRKRYVQNRFPENMEEAGDALGYYDRLTESSHYEDAMFKVFHYYWYTYVRKSKDYPRNFPGEVFSVVYEDKEKYLSILKDVYSNSRSAYMLFNEIDEAKPDDKRLAGHYKTECLHYQVLSNEYLKLIEIAEWIYSHEFSEVHEDRKRTIIEDIIKEISALRIEREHLMLAVENTKSAYSLPWVMRNMSIYRQYLIDLEAYLQGICENVKKGICVPAPLIDFTDTRHIESEMFKLLR